MNPNDPLDDPAFVFDNAATINPADLAGRTEHVLVAFMQRLRDDWGKPGLGQEQLRLIGPIYRALIVRDASPEQVAQDEYADLLALAEVERRARNLDEDQQTGES